MQDKGASAIVLKAMGRAINKAVTIAEIIKVFALLNISLSSECCKVTVHH